MADLLGALELAKSYVVSQALYGAYQVGIWDHFGRDPNSTLSVAAFADENGFSAGHLRGMMEYLARRQFFVESEKGVFALSPQGRQLLADGWLGYIVFFVGGYGKVLERMGEQVNRKVVYGKDVVRDGHCVAVASEIVGERPTHGNFETMLRRAAGGPHRPARVLDIGCGSGKFLLRLMRGVEAEEGFGVDLDEASCELARATMSANGCADRTRILKGDARQLLSLDPNLQGSVDLITAMFVIHEFFGRDLTHGARLLAEIARALTPGRGRLLIMDKHIDILEAEAPLYFTEFKLIHDFTNQRLISRAEWHEVLDQAGLRLVGEEILPRHTGTILLECVPA